MRAFAHKEKPTQQARATNSIGYHRILFAQDRAVRSILELQRTIGNQAVLRLVQSNTEEYEANSATTALTPVAYDFDRISLSTSWRPESERSKESWSIPSRQASQGQLMRQQVRGPTRVRVPQPRQPQQRPAFLRTFRWPRFITTGNSVCAPGVALGANPQGQFLNAMELVFTEQAEAGELRRRQSSRGGFSRYRIRQTIAEQVWQFVSGRWSNLSSTPAGMSDDPDPELQCWNPPELRTIDTPGWSAYQGVGPRTRRFVFSDGQSDPDATIVWVQQNFYTWVEGERAYFGGWERVSVKYPWHSSLRLERMNSTADWRSGPSTRIQPGHMEFGYNPVTESR